VTPHRWATGDKFDAIADNTWLARMVRVRFSAVIHQLRQEKNHESILEKATVSEKKVSLEEFKNNCREHLH